MIYESGCELNITDHDFTIVAPSGNLAVEELIKEAQHQGDTFDVSDINVECPEIVDFDAREEFSRQMGNDLTAVVLLLTITAAGLFLAFFVCRVSIPADQTVSCYRSVSCRIIRQFSCRTKSTWRTPSRIFFSSSADTASSLQTVLEYCDAERKSVRAQSSSPAVAPSRQHRPPLELLSPDLSCLR